MNILTPAALEAAAKAMFETQQDEDEREYGSRDTWDQIHDSAKGYYLKYATIAFNAAIARLIKDGQAKKGKFFNDATEPTIWDSGIFIKGEP